MGKWKQKRERKRDCRRFDEFNEWLAFIDKWAQCPKCEQIQEWVPIPKEGVPEGFREKYGPEVETGEWRQSRTQHDPDCPVADARKRMIELGLYHEFKVFTLEEVRPVAGGRYMAAVRLIRRPEIGDPPVAPEYLVS
jgi:hypothetical protein